MRHLFFKNIYKTLFCYAVVLLITLKATFLIKIKTINVKSLKTKNRTFSFKQLQLLATLLLEKWKCKVDTLFVLQRGF